MVRCLVATAVCAGALVGPAQAKDRPQVPAHDYAYCLAYQQAAWDPDDRVAEACTWTVAKPGHRPAAAAGVRGQPDDVGVRAGRRAGRRRPHPSTVRWPVPHGVAPSGHRAACLTRRGWRDAASPFASMRRARCSLRSSTKRPATASSPRRRPPSGGPSPSTRDHWGPKATRMLVTLSYGRTSYVMRTGHEEAPARVDARPARPQHHYRVDVPFGVPAGRRRRVSGAADHRERAVAGLPGPPTATASSTSCAWPRSPTPGTIAATTTAPGTTCGGWWCSPTPTAAGPGRWRWQAPRPSAATCRIPLG